VSERVATAEAENLMLRQSNSSLNALRAAEERKLKEYEALLLNAEAVNESLFNNYNTLVEDYNQAVRFRQLLVSSELVVSPVYCSFSEIENG
jgi:hypothetical protein